MVYFLNNHDLTHKTEFYYAHIKLLFKGMILSLWIELNQKCLTKFVPNILGSQSQSGSYQYLTRGESRPPKYDGHRDIGDNLRKTFNV